MTSIGVGSRRRTTESSLLRPFRSSQRIAPFPAAGSQSRINVDHDKNAPASKASVIRILCNQISQGLYVASESLNDEMLQELSAEIAMYSLDAIKRKQLVKPCNEDLMSIGGSLQNAINDRMASIVENEVKSPVLREVEKLPSKNRKDSSNKSALNLLAKSSDDNGQYDVFLNICDPNLMTNQQQVRRDYIAFKRSDSNIPFMVFMWLCGTVLFLTGYVWTIDISTYLNYPTAALSVLFAVLTGISFGWVVLNRVVFRYNIVGLQWYHKYVTKLYDSPYGQWPDNMTVVCVALCTGFYLVNIVVMNLCDPDRVVNVGMNDHYACDSVVKPLPESYVFNMISFLLMQIAARGVSRIALVSSWIICFVAINMSLYLSNSGSYVFMNILQVLIICVSYELERQPLRMYLKTLKVVEASEVAAKLKVRLAAYESLQAAEALKAKCSLVCNHYTSSNIIIIIIIITFSTPFIRCVTLVTRFVPL